MLDLTLTVPQATVKALEELSDPERDVVVEAWVMPEPTTESCANDYQHGPGLVQVPISDGLHTECHALCLACAIPAVEAQIEDGRTWISVDVTK
jgi:hypothetical protein